jgi:hydrogenase nickel incorporation protein HypA/HybF
VHEHSLVRSLLSQVEQLAADHGATAVEEIVVAVGALAGVEPLLLASAFEQLASDKWFHHTKLSVEREPLALVCEDCGATFEPDGFAFACRSCSSKETRVLRGEGVVLRNVALRLPQAQEFPV